MENRKRISSIFNGFTYFLFCYIPFCAILFSYLKHLDETDYNIWFNNITLIIIVIIIVQLILFKLANKKLMSIASIFLICSYLFHFSYQILMFIDYDFGNNIVAKPTVRFTETIYREALNLAIIGLVALFGGYLFALACRNIKQSVITRKNEKNNIEYTLNPKYLRYLGICLLIISLPADLYVTFYKMYFVSTIGYGNVDISINPLIVYMSYVLSPAIFLMMVSYIDNKKRTRYILYTYIIYCFISTFNGTRSYAILKILIMMFFYLKTIQKIRIKTMLIGAVFSFIMLSWFIVVRNARSTGLSLSDFFNIFLLKDNVLLNTMCEFGFSINIICYVLSLDTYNVFGGQLLYSFLSIIPKVQVLFPQFENYEIIKALDLSKYGSSYIADFLFDYHQYYYIAMFIFGFLVVKLDLYIEECISKKKYINMAVLIPLIIDLLFCVRSSTCKLPRIFVWSACIFYIVKFLVSLNLRKNKYAENNKSTNKRIKNI